MTAPPLSQSEINNATNIEEKRKINLATKLSLENQFLKNPSNRVNNKVKNECGACSIL